MNNTSPRPIRFHAEFDATVVSRSKSSEGEGLYERRDAITIDTADAARGPLDYQLELFASEAKDRGYRLATAPVWTRRARSYKSYASPTVSLSKAEREAFVGERVDIDGVSLETYKGLARTRTFGVASDQVTPTRTGHADVHQAGATITSLAPRGGAWAYLPDTRSFAYVPKGARYTRDGDGRLHLVGRTS